MGPHDALKKIWFEILWPRVLEETGLAEWEKIQRLKRGCRR